METFFEELKRYVGFTVEDSRSLAAFLPRVIPHLPRISEEFYRNIPSHPGAFQVFDGPEQIERLKRTLQEWARRLFSGPHDDEYFDLRSRIGRMHVKVGLEQRYMVVAMHQVRESLRRIVLEESEPGAATERLIVAVNRALDLDLAVMLESYREDSIARLWQSEKQAALKRLAAIGEVAASVAHEVRNPLAGISGALEVLRDELPADSPRREVIREALLLICRLDERVRDLLIYARPNIPRPSRVSPADMIASTLSLLSEEPMLRDVRVHLDLSAKLDDCLLDQTQMQEVLVNLIRNAADAMKGRGDLYLEAHRSGDRLLMVVEDTGPGVPAGRVNEIFTPFMTTRADGTGLGLSISRRNVEAHGGTLMCETGRQGGARFVVTIPAPIFPLGQEGPWQNVS